MPAPEQPPTNVFPHLGVPSLPNPVPAEVPPQAFAPQNIQPQPDYPQQQYSPPQFSPPGYPPQAPYPNLGGAPHVVPGIPQPVMPQQPILPQPIMPQSLGARPLPLPRREAQSPGQGEKPVRPGARPLPLGSARPIPLQKKEGEISVSEQPRDEELIDDVQQTVVKNMPPVLISTVVHIILVLVLALLIHSVAKKKTDVITVNMEEEIFAEKLGEQLNQDSNMVSIETPDATKIEIAEVNLPAVTDPLAALTPVELVPDGVTASSLTEAPINGIADGRTPGSKKSLLGRFGGNKTTEEAVRRALFWLKRQQASTGAWSLLGPYPSPGGYENPVAATAMALLAFQGYGTTDKTGEFKDVVKKGWDALLKMQNADGCFTSPLLGNHQHLFYGHGPAMIAACELYAMSLSSEYPDPKQRAIFKDVAQRAINYAVKTQDPQKGGWRYSPGEDSDTSVTGWMLMGLVSGKMAGLDVPESSLQKVTAYLDAAQQDGGATYGYRIGYPITAAVSAEGLLMRQYLGWDKNDERLVNGVRKILGTPMDKNNWKVYYWYYATQVCHHMEGDAWKEWNGVMRQMLPETQIRQGAQEGSWDPEPDEWGYAGGRLYMTCFCTYMLEVYYRHMPLYDKIYEQKAKNAATNAGR